MAARAHPRSTAAPRCATPLQHRARYRSSAQHTVNTCTSCSELVQSLLRPRLRARVVQRDRQLQVALHALTRSLGVAARTGRRCHTRRGGGDYSHLLVAARLPQASTSPSTLLRMMAHRRARRWLTAAALKLDAAASTWPRLVWAMHLPGTSAIPKMGYVGASASEVFQRERKRKVFACSIWADRSV